MSDLSLPSRFAAPPGASFVEVDPADVASVEAAQVVVDAAGVGPWAVISDAPAWSSRLMGASLGVRELVGRVGRLTRGSQWDGSGSAVPCRVAYSSGRVWVWPVEELPGARSVVAVVVDESVLDPLGWCVALSGIAVLDVVDASPGVVAAAVSALELDSERAAAVRRTVGPGAQGSQLCGLAAALADGLQVPSPRWCAAARAVRAARRGWPLPDVGYFNELAARASLVEEVAARSGAGLELVAELGADGLGADELTALVAVDVDVGS